MFTDSRFVPFLGHQDERATQIISRIEIASAVRQVFEKQPYPGLRPSALLKGQWLLPPLQWIKAIWQRQQPVRRILIAGCGTGSEAFAFCRRFPNAEIAAVDFSWRAIRAAKDLQRKNRKFQSIRFVVYDLTNPSLPEIVGDGFDFVSCHGVLTYIPSAEEVLRNIARCLANDGVLYLGVNGERHFSERWRQVLPGFGVKAGTFQDTRSVRQLLKLLDALSGQSSGSIANCPSWYLAGDTFGPLIQNWPLGQWVNLWRAAGLNLLGSYSIFQPLRGIFHDHVYRALIPRSRSETVDLFETLRPSEFHRLILSRQAELCPPWKDLRELQNWRLALTQLYHWQWPRKTLRWKTIRKLKLKSQPINTVVDLAIPEWQVEILRRGNGKDSINHILQSIPALAQRGALRDQLYLLYQLCAINLLPPAA
jgi:SAM-dependent methyltransferase